MAKACLLFVAILLSGERLAEEARGAWLVWNVGQGQWVTFVKGAHCWHFDMGGESAPWLRVARWCQRRQNFIFLSHWDWDHIGFAARSRSALPDSCLWDWPEGPASEAKKKGLSQVRPCSKTKPFAVWRPRESRTANGSSRVVLWRDMLMPGDSTKAEEKIWSQEIPRISNTRWLMVGHHGSRTSTSRRLLEQIPHVRQALISARRKRYGHPHPQVLRELRLSGVPALGTEDWGDIAIWP